MERTMFGKREQKMHRPERDTEDDNAFPVGARVVAGLTLGLLLFAGAGGWPATTRLNGAIIASGVVMVEQN